MSFTFTTDEQLDSILTGLSNEMKVSKEAYLRQLILEAAERSRQRRLEAALEVTMAKCSGVLDRPKEH